MSEEETSPDGIGAEERRAEQLGNLADLHFFVGRYADAARLYEEAIGVTAASASLPWAARRRRILLANQASLYQTLRRDGQALAIYRELAESTSTLLSGEQGQLLVNLGALYRRLGDPIKALKTYDDALRFFARGPNADGELGVLKNRGIVPSSGHRGAFSCVPSPIRRTPWPTPTTFSLTDRQWTVSTAGGYEPRWRADGRELYYLSLDQKLMAVGVDPGPSFGAPTERFPARVAGGVSSQRTHYVPSRDGRRFLINTPTGDAAIVPITVVLNWTAALKK